MIDAQPIPNSFVSNIGDMLDRLTGRLYPLLLIKLETHRSAIVGHFLCSLLPTLMLNYA